MPIIVKDYKWFQTENILTIHVPLHGASKSKVDLLTSKKYLKASFEQFFFEVFPLEPINVDNSKCTIHEKEIIYELLKQEPLTWDSLEKIIGKDEKRDIIRKAIGEVQERLKKEHEDKLTKKDKLKKCAVSEAIGIDSQQRKKIEEIKHEEKTKALGDVNKWNKQIKCDTAKKLQYRKYYKNYTPTITNTSEQIPIPRPRSNTIVDVEFTERVLPTPSRESQYEEETEWLKKQAEARRSAGFVSEDLRPEEKNPQYLLAKGNNFLSNENYLGAVSAYSFGIQISPKFVDLYIKRSEGHFKMGNYHKTVNDCSSALDLMKPEVSANLEERAICIGRRGMALHKLGLKRQALEELRASLTLKSDDAEFGKYYYDVLDELNSGKCEDSEPGFDLFK